LYGHVAAHHARELAGNGKADARATEALCGRPIGLAELLEQACCSAVMPIPVSATASSILSGLDLGEVEHLVDEAEQVGADAMHALKRLLRLLCAEARCTVHHHLGQPDDGIELRA
jgi:hypothetical protein